MTTLVNEAGGRVSRRELLAIAGMGSAALLSGCGGASPLASNGKVYRMGELATAGRLIYTVLETEWMSAIGSRVPRHKFLSIRMTINNSGNTERSVPLLDLVDAKGKAYLEESDGAGLDEWFGMLRNLAATETAQGRLLFDVPQDSYKLRVNDGGDPGSEVTALVDIPLTLKEDQRIVAPGGDRPPVDPGAK